MAKTAILSVRIISDATKAAKGFEQVEGKASKFGKALKVAAGGFVIAGGAAKVAYDQMISPAGDLEQSIGAIDTVFKANADQMHAWAKGAATDVGLARNEFNELGTLIGTQLRNGGTAMDQLAPKTNELITLGADLSSMFGGSTKTAVEALSSALKGERDPIEKYGVTLKQSSIDAEAARLGFEKVGGALSAEAQQAATLSLISKQTADAQGNFARESETLQGKQQRLTAQFENAKATLGTGLLPIATQFFGYLSDTALPAVTTFIDEFSKGEGAGGKFRDALSGIKTVVQEVGGFLITHKNTIGLLIAAWAGIKAVQATLAVYRGTMAAIRGIQAGYAAATYGATAATYAQTTAQKIGMLVGKGQIAVTKGMAIAQRLLNAAMRANPIGLIITAITILVGVIVYLYKNNETARKIITAAWNAIKGAVLAVKDWIVGVAWPAIKGAFVAIGDAAVALKDGVVAAWNLIKDGISAAWNWIKDTGSKIIGWFTDLPGKITGALGDVGGMLTGIGGDIIDGLLGGLRAKIGDVQSFFTGLTDMIPDWKGPLPKDKRLLAPAGTAIMGGLIRAIDDERAQLRRTLGDVTQDIAGTEARMDLRTRTGSRAASRISARGGQTINITINGAVDPMSTAKQIEGILDRRRDLLGIA